MRKLLIVGGAGFLGVNLVHYCVRHGLGQITVLDSLEPRLRSGTIHLKPIWDEIKFIRGSMTDEHLVAEAVQNQDIIINCAAQTSHPLSLQDPLFDVQINCMGNLQLLEAVRLLNPQAIVAYTSSSTVIGKSIREVVDESHPERPLDIYSANKGVAEKYYRIYHRVHDLKTVVLRFANLYGPYGKGFPEFGFVNYFISLALRNEEIRLFGGGQQSRNVLFVDDAVSAILKAVETPCTFGEAYFAGGNEHLTVLQIAQTIVNVFGSASISHIDWPDDRKRIEIDNVRISSKQFKELTGWESTTCFQEGLKKTRDMMVSK